MTTTAAPELTGADGENVAISEESLRLCNAMVPILVDFFRLIKNVTLLSSSHVTVQDSSRPMALALNELMADRKVIGLDIGDEVFMLDDVPIISEQPQAAEQVLGLFRNRGIGRVNFKDGVSAADILALARALVESAPSDGRVELTATLEAEGVTRVTLEDRAAEEDDGDEELDGVLRSIDDPVRLYMAAADVVRELHTELASTGGFDITQLDFVIDNILQHIHRGERTLLALASLPGGKPFAYSHPLDTAIVAAHLAASLFSDNLRLHEVARAAFLHDIGRADAADEPRTAPDWIEDSQPAHPQTGAVTIDENEMIEKLVVIVAHDHHRRFDGGGYPRGNNGQPANVFTEIVSLSDAYCDLVAMSADAAYTLLDVVAALREMANTAFAQPYIERLAKVLGPVPTGSIVRMGTGLALVVGADEDGTPVIRDITDSDGVCQPATPARRADETLAAICAPGAIATGAVFDALAAAR
jgi:hypothetical protein